MEDTRMKFYLDLQNKFGEVYPGKDKSKLRAGTIDAIGTMPAGMTSGNPSVGILISTFDGRVIYAETSLRLLQTVVAAMTSQWGDLTDGVEIGSGDAVD